MSYNFRDQPSESQSEWLGKNDDKSVNDIFDDFELCMKDMDTNNGDLIVDNTRYFLMKVKYGLVELSYKEIDNLNISEEDKNYLLFVKALKNSNGV